MNEQTARNLLMDELYGELSMEQKEKLETYLEEHPALREEFDELHQTHALLQKMPEVEQPPRLIVLDPEERSFWNWWRHVKGVLPKSIPGKAALAVAACLALLLIAGSLANLTISNTEGGFSVHLGYADQPQTTTLSKTQAEKVLQQIQQKNVAMMAEYADMLNKQNQQQLQQVVHYFEQQRVNDLQLVDKALNQYQQKNDYRMQQASQVLGKVLQTVASNEQ